MTALLSTGDQNFIYKVSHTRPLSFIYNISTSYYTLALVLILVQTTYDHTCTVIKHIQENYDHHLLCYDERMHLTNEMLKQISKQ